VIAGLCSFLSIATSVACFAQTSGSTKASPSIVEEAVQLPVQIDGSIYRLEAIIVRPVPTEQQRLPIAIITHGAPRNAASRPNFRASGMVGVARDLAHRGWLVVTVARRGFGESQGPFAEGFECEHPDFRHSLDMAAKDIAATARAIAARPDADASHVLGLGVSVGGAAMLAWAAENPPGLVGVINISGGTGSYKPDSNCDAARLISTIAAYGTGNVPSLWLYAENDHFFGPDLVGRLHAAFTASGGSAELRQFGPIDDDGHELFGLPEGRRQWLPELDRFLRARGLPSWKLAPMDAVSAKLGAGPRGELDRFLAATTEKALVLSKSGKLARWRGGAGTLDEARRRSIEDCERDSGEPCSVLVENFTPVGAAAGN
jgi:dienelactone hydrolase